MNMKNLDQTYFPNRAVKTFSFAIHHVRGIILNIGKSLRWGTYDSTKFFKWDYVLIMIKRLVLIVSTSPEKLNIL